jgi:hypothetical protein
VAFILVVSFLFVFDLLTDIVQGILLPVWRKIAFGYPGYGFHG